MTVFGASQDPEADGEAPIPFRVEQPVGEPAAHHEILAPRFEDGCAELDHVRPIDGGRSLGFQPPDPLLQGFVLGRVPGRGPAGRESRLTDAKSGV